MKGILENRGAMGVPLGPPGSHEWIENIISIVITIFLISLSVDEIVGLYDSSEKGMIATQNLTNWSSQCFLYQLDPLFIE